MPDMLVSTNTNHALAGIEQSHANVSAPPTGGATVYSTFILPPSGQSENSNDSRVCLVFRVEEHFRDQDRQVARHVLLCLLLAVGSLAVSKKK